MKKYVLKRNKGEGEKLYSIDYRAELNPQQYKAATATEGAYLVVAGAGTGKTRTLVFRVAYMVENKIPPGSILLLTFTRKAAQEMMRRASSILDERCKNVAGGTFHSFANLLLRKYALNIGLLPNFTIVDRTDAEEILQIIRTNLNLNKKERRFPNKSTLINIISLAINKSTSIKKIVSDCYPHYLGDYTEIMTVEEYYRRFKQEKQLLDYDDLLVYLKQLLESGEDVRKKISDKYRYIMVDEYQDTNRLQAEITVLLASGHHNVMAVGDDSQSIYSFRGANFKNIIDFPSFFPGTVIINLEQNYRSTRPILDMTNAIIEQAREKYPKKLFSNIEGDQKPVFIDGVDEKDQAAFVAQRILETRDEGVPLSHIAVLFRASWHANELELELRNANIPYVKYGGIKFAEAAHVKDTLAYLRVIHNPIDEIAWLRLLLLIDGIGPASAGTILKAVIANGGDYHQLISPAFEKRKNSSELKRLHHLFSSMKNKQEPLSAKMESVLDYYTPIFEKKYDDFHRRKMDLESLLHISERYLKLEHFLSDIALEPPDKFQAGIEPTDLEDEKLVLSTVHSAKGLEWHTVFILHLVEGYFPSTQSLDEPEDIEEERRLFYVAATRAQKNLYLIAPEITSRGSYWASYRSSPFAFSEPSRFLNEIPNFRELTEVGVITFEDPLS